MGNLGQLDQSLKMLGRTVMTNQKTSQKNTMEIKNLKRDIAFLKNELQNALSKIGSQIDGMDNIDGE